MAKIKRLMSLLDRYMGAIVNIDVAHYKNHEGKYLRAGAVFATQAAQSALTGYWKIGWYQ